MVYQIRYYLATPIVLNSDLQFDALLECVHPAAHNRSDVVDRFSPEKNVAAVPLPIDSAKIGGVWVWCCTAGFFDDEARNFSDKFNKRRDYKDFHYLTKRQTPGMGVGRDRLETVYGVACRFIDFYASTKDARELKRIANRVHNLGGMRKTGYGEVSSVEITETSMDWRECLVRSGESVRILPVDMLESCDCVGIDSIRHNPPYWLPTKTQSLTVGYLAELKSEVYLNEVKKR